MRSEIQVKWSKFTSQEVAALKNKDDLVAQVQTKYARSIGRRRSATLMRSHVVGSCNKA
jgi:hypothetical protein